MKKLAILVSLVLAAPVFACPMHDDKEAAPKTADKDKAAPADKSKDQPKKDAAKPAETAKAKEQPKKDAPAKPTKVSQK